MPLPETLLFAKGEQCAAVFSKMTLAQNCIKRREIGNPGKNGSINCKWIVLGVTYKYKPKSDNMKRLPRTVEITDCWSKDGMRQ